jgi:microcystin degradation protein MlrC
MRVFIASLATETNTFAPFPTAMAGFEEYGLGKDATSTDGPLSGPMKVFRSRAEADGHEVIESLSAFAQPSGRTVRTVYERLRDEILADLTAAGPVDIVLMMLHGAMVADGYDDCEGDMIARVRQIAPDAVIGVELDPHCHLTTQMVEQADLIVIGKEYPHIDFPDRAHELYDLCLKTRRGEIRPVAALVDLAMVGFYPTFEGPMRDLVDTLSALEGEGGALSASLAHGFCWADVADVGSRMLVYHDGDAERALSTAMTFSKTLYAERDALLPRFPDIAAALDRQRGINGRTVLGDFADNPGGGAPGDSTFFLRALIERNVEKAVIGAFWDPFVAKVAAEAGVGAKLRIRLGGKCGASSGDPLDLDVTVMGVKEDHSQGVFGSRQPMGRSAWLRTGDIDIAVCSVRTQVFEPDAFTGLGISLQDKRLIVVKSSSHYQAGFGPEADQLWHVCSPGAMQLDFAALPYTLRDPNYHPRVADPWAVDGFPQAWVKTDQGAASLQPIAAVL